MPIVSGNVSLYNETDGVGILPTPTIGAVGLIKGAENLINGTAQDGDTLFLLGETNGHLGQSALLAEAFDRAEGDAPTVDLAQEKAHGDFIRANAQRITACTDLADGGLALAAFELADAAGHGVTVKDSDTATLFGEDQARYLLTAQGDAAEALTTAAQAAGLKLTAIGGFGGSAVTFGDKSAPLSELAALYRSAFADAVA